MERLFDWKTMREIKSCCILLTSLLFLCVGCSSFQSYEIVTAPVISMTHSRLPKNYRLKSGRHFIGKFCEDEKPVYDTGELVGMADQAIYKVQKKFKATHLLDVRISREGDCTIAVGNLANAYKVQKRRRKKRRLSSEMDDFEFTNELLPPDKADQEKPL